MSKYETKIDKQIGLFLREMTECESITACFQCIFRAIADAAVFADLDRRILMSNPSLTTVFGYQDGELLGRKTKILYADPDQFDQQGRLRYNRFAREQLQPYEMEYRRKDGTVFLSETVGSVVRDNRGNRIGFLGLIRDITQRKQHEKDLEKALAEIQSYKVQLEQETACLQDEIKHACNYDKIIGSSNALQYVLFKIDQIAATDTSVVILGETGTGKELIARAIHKNSPRKDRPLIKINCAALPADLIESELFGHERGAFTGAHARRAGRFEIANGATLFLDEIGELPLDLQVKLLRVLQEGEFERVGSSKTIKVNVRIIAATNRDLEKDVLDGRFRQDLWYRLNVFPITAPPLRDRLDDIEQLAVHFTRQLARQQGKTITNISPKVLATLRHYPWPGNIRELENVIERAVINSLGPDLHLADTLRGAPLPSVPTAFKSLREMEKEYILQVLEHTNWKVSGKNSAAEILQMDRSTLRARMKKLGIRKP